MLIEIKCDKFKEQPQGFSAGLNVIVGSDDGGNSIGKSTFLMIIDYVFGGSDYLEKSIDVHKNIGEHDIFFAFKFNNEISRFCRNTLEKSIVYVCDEAYNKTRSITLDQYLDFLKNNYGVNYDQLSFRNEIGRFFRVYGRENLQEKKPIHAFHADNGLNCINSILKLFNKYFTISEAEHKYDSAQKEKKAIDQASQYSLVKKIGAREYKNNVKLIETLEEQIEKIIKETDAGLKDNNSIITDEVLRLKEELSKLRISRSRNIHERNKLNKYSSSKTTPDQYVQLQNFFPNVNLEKICEFEGFHEAISNILNDEIRQELQRYDMVIAELTKTIESLESQIKERSSIQSLSRNVLLQLTSLQKQKEQLIEQNELYDKYSAVLTLIKDLKAHIVAMKKSYLEEIQAQINIKMELFNDYIYNGQNKAPIISFGDSNYSFTTPDDTGTGTSYKSMIVYDLAVLSLTGLPILVHDSYLLKQIQDAAIEKILELYMQSEKQIFISIDKINSLTDRSITIIEENKVLTLYPNGGELFGRCWNKK